MRGIFAVCCGGWQCALSRPGADRANKRPHGNQRVTQGQVSSFRRITDKAAINEHPLVQWLLNKDMRISA